MDTPLDLHVLYTGIAPIFRWLKASGVSIACEEKMRDIARSTLGDNLKGEIAPFSFPILLAHSGGIEMRGMPHVFMPDLIKKVTQLWHNDVIPANEIFK